MIKPNRKEEFSKEVEKYMMDCKCTVMEALVDITKEKNLEIESVSKLLTDYLKEQLTAEAEELNLIKRDKVRLPI